MLHGIEPTRWWGLNNFQISSADSFFVLPLLGLVFFRGCFSFDFMQLESHEYPFQLHFGIHCCRTNCPLYYSKKNWLLLFSPNSDGMILNGNGEKEKKVTKNVWIIRWSVMRFHCESNLHKHIWTSNHKTY